MLNNQTRHLNCVGSEMQLAIQIADALRLKYPHTLFHFDYGSGTLLTKASASLNHHLNGRGWHDLFIAGRSRFTDEHGVQHYYLGCTIELKVAGTKLIRERDQLRMSKDDYKIRRVGDWWDVHIEEQAAVRDRLRQLGYFSDFACGFDQVMALASAYIENRTSGLVKLGIGSLATKEVDDGKAF